MAISTTQAIGPPIIQMTTMKISANGTSMKVVSVAEVRKSRMDSNSLSVLARAPLLPRRVFICASRICSNKASAIAPSVRALARSRK